MISRDAMETCASARAFESAEIRPLRYSDTRELRPAFAPKSGVSRGAAVRDRAHFESALIIDDQPSFAQGLLGSLRDSVASVHAVSSLPDAKESLKSGPVDLIVSELKLEGRAVLESIALLREIAPASTVVIVTAYPSVATAIQAMHLGFDAYLGKPVSASLIFDTLRGLGRAAAPRTEPPEPRWPSLDRTIWEYLNQALLAAGSVSEAARRLGLDRRSLRRMLAKYPPAK